MWRVIVKSCENNKDLVFSLSSSGSSLGQVTQSLLASVSLSVRQETLCYVFLIGVFRDFSETLIQFM